MRKMFLGGLITLAGVFGPGELFIEDPISKKEIFQKISNVSLLDVPDLCRSGSCVPIKCQKDKKEWKVVWLSSFHILQYKNKDGKIVAYKDNLSILSEKNIKYTDVKLIATLPKMDLIMVSGKVKEPVKVFEIDFTKPGPLADVYAAGYPFGKTLWVTEGVVTGSLSKGNYKISSPVISGKSGGAIVDKVNGKLIGVIKGVIQNNNKLYPDFSIMVPLYTFKLWINKNLND